MIDDIDNPAGTDTPMSDDEMASLVGDFIEKEVTGDEATEPNAAATDPQNTELNADQANPSDPNAVNDDPSAQQQQDQQKAQNAADQANNEAQMAPVVLSDANAVVQLPDGTKLTVEELAGGNLRQSDYTRKTQELSEQRRAFEAQVTETQQLQQRAQQERGFLAEYLKTTLPPKPTAEMAKDDPIGYLQAQQAYDAQVQQLQQIQQIQAQESEQQQAQDAAEMQEFQKREREAMYTAYPEFKDQAKLDAFWNDVGSEFVPNYGFSKEEVGQINDHRMLGVMRDAIAYRKLQAQAPNVQRNIADPAKNLSQKARPNAAAQSSQDINARIAQAEKSGNFDGVSDLLSEYMTQM